MRFADWAALACLVNAVLDSGLKSGGSAGGVGNVQNVFVITLNAVSEFVYEKTIWRYNFGTGSV